MSLLQNLLTSWLLAEMSATSQQNKLETLFLVFCTSEEAL